MHRQIFLSLHHHSFKNAKIMQTSTLIIILAVVVALLVVLVALLIWHSYRQERDMKLKDDSIVREVRRNQKLIDYGVSQGLSRSAMLGISE